MPETFINEIVAINQLGDTQPHLIDVQPAIEDATAKICQQIQACQAECDKTLAACQACVSGQIGVGIDKVDALINKCIAKIQKPIDDGVTATYFHSYSTLGNPPSIEQVVSDILGEPIKGITVPLGGGGVGLTGPSDQPPTDRVCTDGFHWGWTQSQGWHCVPDCVYPETIDPQTGMCIPPNTQGQCNVILPTPCEIQPNLQDPACIKPGPPCEKPPSPCPPGQAWYFDPATQTYQCTPNGQPPGQNTQGNTQSPEFDCENILPFCDVTGVEDWEKTIQQFNGSQSDTAKYIGFDPAQSDAPPSWWPFATLKPGRLVWTAFAGLINYTTNFLWALKCMGSASAQCLFPAYALFTTIKIVPGFLGRWIGLDLGQFGRALDRSQEFACPIDIPSPGEIDAMWRSGQITDKGHENLRRAYALCPEWANKLRDTMRTRFTLLDGFRLVWKRQIDEDALKKLTRELGYTKDSDWDNIKKLFEVVHGVQENIALWQRQIIKENELTDRLKKLGYVDDQTREERVALSEWIPGPSDIINLMLRDVFDEGIVGKYNYDKDFGQKYTDVAKNFAKANGVPDYTMQLYWRAHWRNPSPDFLFRSLQRLRADSLDPQYKANAITEDDVRTFLDIDDYQPWWVDKYIAMAKEPMRMVDLRQAYDIGTLKDEECKAGLKDLGYTDYAADKVFEYWQIRKQQRRWTTAGGMTARKILKLYKDRVISYSEARDYLLTNGVPPNEVDFMLEDAFKERDYRDREREIKALQRRYRVGDLSPDDVVPLLTQAGLETENAVDLAGVWEIEQQLRGKEIAATMLCKWRYRGLITAEEQWVRLVRVGYSQTDATRIVAACAADVTEWAQRAMMTQLKDADWLSKHSGKKATSNGTTKGGKK